MGRPLRRKSRRGHGRDQCLHRLRPASLSAGHHRQQGPCRHARQAGHHFRARCRFHRPGSRHNSVRDRDRRVQLQPGARGHPYERGRPAVGADRAGGRPAAHCALAQRSGGDRFPPVDQGHDRRARRRAGALPAGVGREGARQRHDGDAGLHASADRAAGDLGASSLGLCRDGGARPRPLRGCAPAPQRMSARRRGARRHRVPDRPRHDRQGARLRPPQRQFARRRLGSRFRAGDALRRRHHVGASVALRRGDRDLDVAASRGS